MAAVSCFVAIQVHSQVCMVGGHHQNMQRSERSHWKPSLEESWGQVLVHSLLTVAMALVRSLHCTGQQLFLFML